MSKALEGPTILVGTAAWSGKRWSDGQAFYPPDCTSASALLQHYAAHFSLVEINTSYYNLPTPRAAQLWVERTPAEFVFHIKAFRLLTGHPTAPKALPKAIRDKLSLPLPRWVYARDLPPEALEIVWQIFLQALPPLRDSGKLAAVHFQFAPRVMNDAAGLAHVQACVQRMQGFPMSVEFRHESWLDDAHASETLAQLRAWGVVHTIVDAPQGHANSVPAVWVSSHPSLALLRIHGRNTAQWNDKTPQAMARRFNYRYGDEELNEMLNQLRALSQQVPRIHVVFNNYPHDLDNAWTLQNMLTSNSS